MVRSQSQVTQVRVLGYRCAEGGMPRVVFNGMSSIRNAKFSTEGTQIIFTHHDDIEVNLEE